MTFRRTRQTTSSRRPPNRSWAGFASTTITGVSPSTKVLLGVLTLANPGIDETILRNVGTLTIESDQTSAAEQQLGAFGMIVVNDIALAAGAASIPGPVTDRSDDGWFVYVPIVQTLRVATAVGLMMSVQYHFDSKAKRKVQEGFGIALMVENVNASHVFNIATVFRTLSQITGT